MKLRQTLVVAACLVIGVILWFLPRTALSAKTESTQSAQNTSDVNEQVELLKKELSATDLSKLESLEQELKKASGPNEKMQWYDSLSKYWDRQMRPGIASEYVYFMAATGNQSGDWLKAGKRFLGLANFFSPEERSMLLTRAVECLEKAYAADSLNPEIQTDLGIAYTQSGNNPMKGISLLKEVSEKDPENFDAQFNLGVFSMQSGQYGKAAERFRTALQLRADLHGIRLYLSDALAGAGQKEEARKELNELKKLTQDTSLIGEANRRLQQLH